MILGSFLNSRGKPKANGICSPDTFRQIIEKERCRADRNDHRFSLVVVILNPEAVNGNGIRLKKSIHLIRERIRNVDEIGWYADGQVGIILPYTPTDGARKLAMEICSLLEPWVGATECEVYSYPVCTSAKASLQVCGAGLR
jgi:hypothetical protein